MVMYNFIPTDSMTQVNGQVAAKKQIAKSRPRRNKYYIYIYETD